LLQIATPRALASWRDNLLAPRYAPLPGLPRPRCHIDTILAESPRLEELYDICERAFHNWKAGHAKNVFVVAKRPVYALLIQVALEKRLPGADITLASAKPSLVSGNARPTSTTGWSSRWPRRRPGFSSPPHAVGVDTVKAASYYVHFGLTTSSEVEKQATGRVRPRGNDLPCTSPGCTTRRRTSIR
jgi:hypothetical protein